MFPILKIWLFLFICFTISINIKCDLAIDYLKLSYATYCPPPDLYGWNCTFCIPGQIVQNVIQNTNTDNLAIITIDKDNNRLNLVFRGSHSVKNFIQDLQFFKIDMPLDGIENVYIASGFYKAYSSISNSIIEGIDNVLQSSPNIEEIYIAGHSLGGAMASIAAIDLKYRLGYNVVGSYTFGSPRVGNMEFSKFYSSIVGNTIRYTNNNDIVPHLPPKIFGFNHLLRESWINGTSIIECSRVDSEDPNCSDSVSVLNYSVSDHLDYFGIEENCIQQYLLWKLNQEQ